MKIRFNKKLVYCVMGSLILGLSSVMTPILVLSNLQKSNIKYYNEYEFSDINDIQESFKKATISEETTNSYIKSIKQLNSFNKKRNSKKLTQSINDVQNEISMRRINNNYSLDELSYDINSVKSILQNDSEAYLKTFIDDQFSYDYLNALYVKNNLVSWSSLNNVKKYDIIYDNINSIYDSISNFYNLFYLKKLIINKQIEIYNQEIKSNYNKISEIKSQINSQDKIIKKKQDEINFLDRNFINSSYFEEINKQWEVVNGIYIAATTSASIAVTSAALSFIPIIGAAAFVTGTAAALTASGLSVALSVSIEILKDELSENNIDLLDIGKFIAKISLSFNSYSSTLFKFSENLLFYIGNSIAKSGFKLVASVAGINMITAAIQIAIMTREYIVIRNNKNEYIDSMISNFNNHIQNSIKDLNWSIFSLNTDIYNKNIEIINIKSRNLFLEQESFKLSEDINILNNQFNLMPSSLSNLPLISQQIISEISNNSRIDIDKLKEENINNLYIRYDKLIEISENLKDERNIKYLNFYRNYNYDDKSYWNEILLNSVEPIFNYTKVLFK